MLRQIVEDSPLPFASRGVESWPGLEAVLAKALSKKPPDRFQSMTEFAEAWKAAEVIPLAGSATGASESEAASFDKARAELDKMIARLQADGPLFASGLPTTPKLSLTYGSAGIAYALLRIACVREDPALLSLADLWAARGRSQMSIPGSFYSDQIEITPDVVGKISPYHTASGIHAVQALIASAMSDVPGQQIGIDEFIAAVTASSCENLDVTLGRSGVLLTASLLLNAVAGNSLVDASRLMALGDRLSAEIWSELVPLPPIREGHEIRYSGAAHGWCGILYALLSWYRSRETNPPAGIEERLVQLAGLAEYVGRCARWNWMISRHPRSDAGALMSGWCNGTAGFVFLWSLAHQAFKNEQFLMLAEKSAWHAWEGNSELGNLCCGLSGQAYALLRFYKDTGDKAWLHRAEALAQKAAEAFSAIPQGRGYEALAERPDSLYKGELGVALLAAELEKPQFAAMPFFEVC